MQLFFNEETNIYRTMFCRESKKSVTGISVLDQFIGQIHETVMNSNNIHEIQRQIRMMSIVCDILQAFNSTVESLMSSLDEKIYNDIMAKSPNSICLRVKDWAGDLSSYQIGDKFFGMVSYVLEGESKLCFIQDQSKEMIQNFKPYVKSAFEGIPNYGEIFGLEVNLKFFRAIRIDTEATGMTIRVRLIDIGEMISVSPNVYKYNLTDEAKQIPPMAMLSRIEKIDGKLVHSLSGLYKKVFQVKIMDIYVNMLEVELCTEAQNGFEDDPLQKSIIECMEMADREEELPGQNASMVVRQVNQNPFLDDNDIQVEVHPQHLNGYQPQTAHTTKTSVSNGFHAQRAHQATSTSKSYQVNTVIHPAGTLLANGYQTKPTTVSPPKMTSPAVKSLPPVPPRQPKPLPQIRIPINIVRRTPAVEHEKHYIHHFAMKYANGEVKLTERVSPTKNDEKRMNGNQEATPISNSCPCETGAHPKTINRTNIEKQNNLIEAHLLRELLPVPMKGEEKSVTPMHFIDAEFMYVQYTERYKEFEEYQFTTLQQLQPKQLSYIPKVNDLILSRYNDQFIYRARVEKVEQHTFTVFYVDYGNTETVGFDALFEWDELCDIMPFQAVKYRIANIRSLPGSSAREIKDYIQKIYLNGIFKAKVLNVSDDVILATMMNTNGLDIVDEVRSALFSECIV
ncbi:uncharacterized protein LOC116342832 isoform X2 [Contarinia nasturtii]|uniref:uncharacterized protein LOC116342832 isoform X2 n=1 Tax=Contarinia nasturtii TaxID=265458 RepID=UPI0012D49848|nr:uncharacterized protein LOC116342832 isoform X2 [Contarinia nasturtii]